MSFTAPKLSANGRRLIVPDVKEPLGDGQRCLVCFETDPARYANCDKGDCYPVGKPEPEPVTGFTTTRPYVLAFDLASRMRAKALRLEWDEDEIRNRLLKRARELERGDFAEVPDEEF